MVYYNDKEVLMIEDLATFGQQSFAHKYTCLIMIMHVCIVHI